MQDHHKFSLAKRIRAFVYAFNGLNLFFKHEHSARVHAFAALSAIGMAWYFQLSKMEWLAVLFAIALVLVSEILNTAIEKLADVVSPVYHPKIKIVKDLAAAAVLLAALFSVCVAAIIFLPKLLSRFG
ncbi:diacylglycerol kinase family protein [Pedobacter sandarakinus]|uniref:diacylglycerol kinase family protein n=1 Tax=Pedobacter sandarakinus TaxID=353156 RepID=UPI002247A3F5|nr:diacylglycerol kinase family protein [Pedobacter sandarakinus]MCX2575040.1 diacylglycerol kinase family protein [Pedobacter sandarakinus]